MGANVPKIMSHPCVQCRNIFTYSITLYQFTVASIQHSTAQHKHTIEFHLCARCNLIFTTILSAPFIENKFIDYTHRIHTNVSAIYAKKATNANHNLNHMRSNAMFLKTFGPLNSTAVNAHTD